MANLTNDYIAFIWGRAPGMAGAVISDIYAARDIRTLTSMVMSRGLSAGEFVRYGRNIVSA
jgi:hypothetical protein